MSDASCHEPPVSLAEVRGFILDLDGTLYVGDRLLFGAAQLIELLRRQGRPFVCVTNNSSRSGQDYREKLGRLGIAVGEAELLTSGLAAAHHLRYEAGFRSAYVVGTPALRAELAAHGIAHRSEDPDCVLVGYDTTLDYEKLCAATKLLMAGKPYLATHPDRTCITPDGLLPDIAAIIGALEAVTGRSPRILGKPERALVRAAAARMQLLPTELAVVGDQLDTDIAMARRHGMTAVLLLSGETTRARLDSCPETLRPHEVFPSVAELVRALQHRQLDEDGS